MRLTIKSNRLGREITFSQPGGFYIFADLNGKEGTLGNQICEKGRLIGPTLYYDGDDEKKFSAICRKWLRSYYRNAL